MAYPHSAAVAAYRRDGVTRVHNLLASHEIDKIRAALKRYETEVLPRIEASDYVLERDGGVRNLWRMEHHDPYFAELGRHPAVLDVVGRLLEAPPVLAAVETFSKPARHGSGVPPHQDNAYFCQTPPDMLTVWVAIDPARADNGPVQYLRNSNEALLPHKGSGVPGNSMVLAEHPEPEPERTDSAVLDPGDAMIHHCQTIHWSTPNRTDQARCGLLLVYCAEHTRTDPELRRRYDEAQRAFADGSGAA